jgi:hypothetical protein
MNPGINRRIIELYETCDFHTDKGFSFVGESVHKEIKDITSSVFSHYVVFHCVHQFASEIVRDLNKPVVITPVKAVEIIGRIDMFESNLTKHASQFDFIPGGLDKIRAFFVRARAEVITKSSRS